jgi:L-asparaginase
VAARLSGHFLISQRPVKRPVCVLSAGGTIAMVGDRAVPALDGAALVAAVPQLRDVHGLQARSVRNLPGPQVGLDDALAIASAAIDAATEGFGVVVTHGTDTLEETAFLCDLMYAREEPIVFTGAIRPASAPGADGSANLLDAVAVAASQEAAGLGAVCVFAGEVHAARAVRKTASAAPDAFGSPVGGPIGRVTDGGLTIHARPARRAPLAVTRLDARVPIVPTAMGDDGALLRSAAADADGVVFVALGAGHVPVPVLGELRAAAATLPVVVTCRPERGALLHHTYGFEGSESDVRASGAIPAGALSPQAARVKLLAALGAGLHGEALRAVFAVEDA